MANENEVRELNMKKGMLESAAIGVLEAMDKRRELTGEINDKKEEIILLLDELGITDYHFDLEEVGEVKLVDMLVYSETKSKLNKKELAETLGVERGDLDTRGIIELSEEGTLTTSIYQDHIEREDKVKLVLKKKRKAKKEKEKEKEKE